MAPIRSMKSSGSTGSPAVHGSGGLLRLRVEFAALYLAAPLAVAVLFPPRWMFAVLFAVTAVGLVLLLATPGFRLKTLFHGIGRISWTFVLVAAGITAVAAASVSQRYAPEYFLLIRRNPELMLMIAGFYPWLSALPQELVFRVLYFQRYGAILPRHAIWAVPLNAGIFAFAHLMYWSQIVAVLTFAGGLVFAYSYRVRRNFPEAFVLHAVAGLVVFAMGLGVFFYSGNVRRPF